MRFYSRISTPLAFRYSFNSRMPSIFHQKLLGIRELKEYLNAEMRL